MNIPKRLQQLLPLILILVIALYYLLNFLVRPSSSAPPGNARTDGTCGNQFAFGKPSYSGPDRTQTVCHGAFAALSSLDKKVPLYSAEHIVGRNTVGSETRTNDFRPDETLPPGQRAEVRDYLRSGYDRGHMSPAADFKKEPKKMSESFYLSNMVPQNHVLNAEAWAGLESATRDCARTLGEVYVVSGPIFSGRFKTIGSNKVAVPDAVYKIVVDPKGSSRAFVFANKPASKQSNYLDRAVSIESIERQTGLTFFPQGGVDKKGSGQLCTREFSS